MQTTLALWYVGWIFVPMVPAFLFFKIFPSDATATGPLLGMRWKLGGAFAGYAFVFLAVNLFLISDVKKAILADHAAQLVEQKLKADAAKAELGEPWYISGKIQKPDGSVVRSDDAQFTTQPPILQALSDFSFSYPILLPYRKPGNDHVVLTINCPPFQPVILPLPKEDEVMTETVGGKVKYRAVRKPGEHTIYIEPMIVLEDPNPPYKP